MGTQPTHRSKIILKCDNYRNYGILVWMVKDGASLTRIKHYLHRFVLWWATTSALWHYEEILQLYSQSCWDKTLGAYAYELLRDFTLSPPDLIGCQVAA